MSICSYGRQLDNFRRSCAMTSAIVLLSGGLDSSTVLAFAKHLGYDVSALSFRYGQRHVVELAAARRVVDAVRISEHIVVDLDQRAFRGSALIGDNAVPHHNRVADIATDIPATYVPARNTIFLSFALALAEVRSIYDIFIGVSAIDYSGYPDCRPEYIAAFEQMANLATKAGVEGEQRLKVHTPLINLTKAQTIELGLALGVDYGLTHSCYDPRGSKPCGTCDSCLLRIKGFAELGLLDPLYRSTA